jgi:hypothetical protein
MNFNLNFYQKAALWISLLAVSAITAIAFHALNWVPLYYSARLCVIPAFSAIFIYGILRPKVGTILLHAWLYGVIAVSIYDLSRIPFMMMGWGDFIPSIGYWMMNSEEVSPLIGYIWRYIGNGGGLGIAFVLILHFFKLKINSILAGIIYGLAVWSALSIILLLSPNAQELMFSLKPLSVLGSFIGHFVFGIVLGWQYQIDKKYLSKRFHSLSNS